MIDSHAHLNFPELVSRLDEVLENARLADVDRMIIPGTNPETSASAVGMAEVHPKHLFAAIGIHPSDAESYDETGKAVFKELLTSTTNLVAIGEVGLDYYHEDSPAIRASQKEVFVEMITLAKDYSLPLIIHSREAFTDLYEILAAEAKGHPTVIHCFTGTQEQAVKWLDVGCLLSFTGIITYKKNEPLREVVKNVPLERIMLETDAPFLAPEGFRGQVCEPKFVRQVAECVAALQNKSLEEVAMATTLTTEQFFSL